MANYISLDMDGIIAKFNNTNVISIRFSSRDPDEIEVRYTNNSRRHFTIELEGGIDCLYKRLKEVYGDKSNVLLIYDKTFTYFGTERIIIRLIDLAALSTIYDHLNFRANQSGTTIIQMRVDCSMVGYEYDNFVDMVSMRKDHIEYLSSIYLMPPSLDGINIINSLLGKWQNYIVYKI